MSAQPSAVWPRPSRLVAMGVQHLDAVVAIEKAAYEFPWSRGNFIDSLAAGYPAQVLLDAHGTLLAYFVAMVGVDEWHLLNITVAPSVQGQGHGRRLLDAMLAMCRQQRAATLWLEVRDGNARAQAVYARYGFSRIGVRRNYYPAPLSRREDAVVMRLVVLDGSSAGEPGAV
jgi:[ribosomal protein S18]-alanine N-acetyltransferase